ncbi:hypothetical protein JOQ06_009126, partial [Pogonophryne albipinna]
RVWVDYSLSYLLTALALTSEDRGFTCMPLWAGAWLEEEYEPFSLLLFAQCGSLGKETNRLANRQLYGAELNQTVSLPN